MAMAVIDMVDMATGMGTVVTVITATVAGGAVAGMAMAAATAGAGLRMATSGFATDPGTSNSSLFQEGRRLRPARGNLSD
jgi:hypothetical protein